MQQQQQQQHPQHIHKVLSELSPATRESLLMLLQQDQQQQQQQRQQQQQQLLSLPNEQHFNQWNQFPQENPQALYPSSDPLHQPFQQLNHQLEFFSPLTSPALRPLGYTSINSDDHQLQTVIPALIDQAATLGLSTPQSFIPQDLITSNSSAPQSINLQNNYLTTPPTFPSAPNFLIHSNPPTTHQLPIKDLAINPSNPSPSLLPHQAFSNRTLPNTKTSPRQTHLSGRPRPTQSNKSRHSPLVRPADDSSNPTDHRSGSTKRARSLTRISVPTSPDFPSVLAKIGLADSPSPIDLYSRPETNLSSCVKDKNPTTHAITPPTPPTVPLPQTLAALPNNSNTWQIQPMTPASLLNFEKPLALTSAAIGNPHHDVHEHTEGLVCGKLDSVQETDESFGDAVTIDKANNNTLNDQITFKDHNLNPKDHTGPTEQNCNKSKNPDQATKKKNTIDSTRTKRGKSKEDQAGEKSAEARRRQQAVRIQVKDGTNEEVEEEVPEHRKSSHKVAEQRRRDSLKMCFEDLRQLLPPIQWNEKEEQLKRPGEGNVGGQRSGNAYDPSNPNKGISKVALLRRSNEYIVRLKERLKRRDGAIEKMVQILQENLLLELVTTQHAPDSSLNEPPNNTLGHDEQVKLNRNHHVLLELKSVLEQISRENQEDNEDSSNLNNDNSNSKGTSGSSLSEELD